MKLNFRQEIPIIVVALSLFCAITSFFIIYILKTTELKITAVKDEMSEIEARSINSNLEILGKVNSLSSRSDSLLAIIRANEAISGKFSEKIGEIDQTVGHLQKLTSMDPELLKKYSKIYFLNEHYVPSTLATIDSNYLYNPASLFSVHTSVLPFLKKMIEDAQSVGVDIKVLSAFRSFGSQATLKSTYKFTYGAGTANSFSAEQGYSEHQLGTTVDFTNEKIGNTFKGFDQSKEFSWLVENAHKYGFVLSYPKENTYYMYEPWHWRFVGVKLATLIHDKSTYFYAVDQREIDSYLGSLFDQ